MFEGVIYKENEGFITYVDERERELLLMTPGILFAHPDENHGGGGHGHALKEPLSCNVPKDNQNCFEWPGMLNHRKNDY